MISLRNSASRTLTTSYELASGVVEIPTWVVQFPLSEDRLPSNSRKATYAIKPLVEVDGEGVFGEIAIVRWLARDGWGALWADTFHGRKFWRDMPHMSEPVEPPSKIRALYTRIAELKGGPSGCFDVVAWKGERIIWMEYKGPKDKPNRNEALWIDAAIRAGVKPEDLIFVGAAMRGGRPSSPDLNSLQETSEPATMSSPPSSGSQIPSGIYEPDSDRDYYAWLSSHPAGYVLSLKGRKEPMLHRAECSHIDRNNNSITAAPKICSEDRKALGAWVREHGLGNGIVLNKCRSCAP